MMVEVTITYIHYVPCGLHRVESSFGYRIDRGFEYIDDADTQTAQEAVYTILNTRWQYTTGFLFN